MATSLYVNKNNSKQSELTNLATYKLGVQPTMQELTDAIRSSANGKAVGSDGVSVELFKMSLKGDLALDRRLLDIVVRIGGGGRVSQQ